MKRKKRWDQNMTGHGLAEIIQSFVDGSCGFWDWDDLAYFPLSDPTLDAIRVEAVQTNHCTPEGLKALREMIVRLQTLG